MGIKRLAAAAVCVTFLMAGCATLREHPTACKALFTLTGATMGAVGGGVGLHNSKDNSSGNTAAGAAGGFVGGGLVGYILGHYICQEEEAPPPPPPPPPAKGTKIAEIPGPNFDFNKSTLTPEGQRKVAEAAKTLKDNPTIHVEVAGYTDSIGSDAYNLKLGERRARTVYDELVKDGIPASRMTVKSYGKANPVASNATAEGRAKNRRVELVVD